MTGKTGRTSFYTAVLTAASKDTSEDYGLSEAGSSIASAIESWRQILPLATTP